MAVRKPVVSVPEGGNPTLGLEQIPTGDTLDPAVLPAPVIPAHDTTGPTGTGPEFEHYNTAERGVVDAEVIASAAHRVNVANPHAVSAAQAGAEPVNANIQAHIIDTANPHGVTAGQAGADPVGSAATVQGNLNTHEADVANPHAVSLAQVGAEAANANIQAHVSGPVAGNPHGVTFTEAVAADAGTDITPAEAETLTDGSNADALHSHSGGGGGLPGRVFEADQLESPNNADWAVNALAPLNADSNNAGLNIRAHDDTIEEGTGFKIHIPAAALNVVISIVSRAETTPPAVRTVGLDIYEREIPDNAAPTAWSAGLAMTDLSIPTNENFQYDSQTFTLAALGVTADSWHQFELVRTAPGGGTDLVGDWDLLALKVDFS